MVRGIKLRKAIFSPSLNALDPLRDARWPEFISLHRNASVFHSREWLRALHMTYGYEPIAFTTCRPSEELRNALVFCIVRSWITGARLVSLPFSDHCDPLVGDDEELHGLLSLMNSVRRQEQLGYIEIRSTKMNLRPEGDFGIAATDVLHRLDLAPSLEALYERFHNDCIKRKIKRATREGLTVQAGRSAILLNDLVGLLEVTRMRHQIPPQPLKWFQNLVDIMGDCCTIRIAYKAGLPIAGILTLRHGNTVTFKYGGSDKPYSSLGGTPMLLWEAIKGAKQEGGVQFDFGRSDNNNEGLILFKDRWGANRFILTRWISPRGVIPKCFDKRRLRIAKKILSVLPSYVVKVIGNAFYRHIG